MIDQQHEALLQIVESRHDLAGRFTNIQRIDVTGGDGNFSLIFSAIDRSSGREVAIKVFNPIRGGDSYRLRCFEREADILSIFAGIRDILELVAPRSEFVETVKSQFGISFEMPFRYFVVELASESVRDVIVLEKWDAEKKLIAFRAMCRAVQRIHSHQVVHRDIKPSNFLVMASGDVKLSDLGTARHLESQDGPFLDNYERFWPGDIRYMPPETMAGLHDIYPRMSYTADIYALAATLYELFSGAPMGVLLFDERFVADLGSLIPNMPRARRIQSYNEMIGGLAATHPLPSLAVAGTSAPRCIRDRVEWLYKEMAALDYRLRLTDFQRIYRMIEICLVILRHESAYQRRQEEKRRRRRLVATKRSKEGAVL